MGVSRPPINAHRHAATPAKTVHRVRDGVDRNRDHLHSLCSDNLDRGETSPHIGT